MKTNNRMHKVDAYTKKEVDEKLSYIVAAPVFLPSQIGQLPYTGGELTPTWDNYDSSKLEIGGTISATDGGTYETTFTPKSGYTWADGTTDTKTTTWKISVPTYGAIWDGTSTTAWTRTDDAEFFEDPVPYVKGATSYGSPFDNIYPWSNIIKRTSKKKATSAVGKISYDNNTLVSIPKFWYKWTQSGSTLKLQISPVKQKGFYVSPAHADRGDGNGERDFVYVGRYHCGSDYTSATGVKPIVNITRSTARTGITALGTGIYQWDMAMLVTIQMLYLVEFADWDAQTKIGYGCGNGSAVENVGASDSMPYHTGTMQSSRDTYGVGVQYRYIEGLWDNCCDWLDGCYDSSSGMYVITNPADFSDSSNGILIAKPVAGHPTQMSVSTVSGLEWVIYPTATGGNETTYTTDSYLFFGTRPCLYVGGYWLNTLVFGLFYVFCNKADYSCGYIGTRLMVFP